MSTSVLIAGMIVVMGPAAAVPLAARRPASPVSRPVPAGTPAGTAAVVAGGMPGLPAVA